MDLSSSIFDYDFGTGFDDFGIGAFDDFGADFQRAFDFDFGTTFDAGFSNFEGLVTAEFDDESIGDWSGGSGRGGMKALAQTPHPPQPVATLPPESHRKVRRKQEDRLGEP